MGQNKATQLIDQYANEYEVICDIDRIEASNRARIILEHAVGKSVLEMGLGFGLMTPVLAKRFRRVVALDGSIEVIQRVKKALGTTQNVTLVHSLFEDYMPDSLFDVIVMSHILEHVIDPVAILSQAKEWLELEGKIHILVPHAYSFHRRLGRAMGMLESETQVGESDQKNGHLRVYTFESLNRDIEEANLTIELMQGMMIKPLSTLQMNGWSPRILNGLYQLGMEMPELCSEIYAVVR